VSLLAYITVYSIVFGAGAYYLVRLVRRGFPAAVDPHEPKLAERSARPLSAATDLEVTP
jgi:cytochrome d ubiquinol oxidase subunit I